MPIRRVPPSNSSVNLSTQAQSTPPGTKPSPSLPSITRSQSPSGMSGFFSRPSKWFARSNSSPRTTGPEPRLSTSSISSQRKPTISGPSDPRPIDILTEKETKLGGGNACLASRSVLDLSQLDRASSDLNSFDTTPGGLGDLRAVSRKAWSRSADNLTSIPSPKLSMLDTSFATQQKSKIEQYRNSPSTPVSKSPGYPFPAIVASPSSPATSEAAFPVPNHAHSRSISHTPNASPSTRLAPPSPQQHGALRKRSADFDRAREKPAPTPTSSKSGAFSFHFGGAVGTKVNGSAPSTVPTVIEPGDAEPPFEESKRASQIVHRSGFVNRLQTFSPSSPQLSSGKNWKPFKLVLKGSKLYFYKPPSDRSAAIKDLFPSGLVAVLEEAMEQDEDDIFADAGSAKKAREDARKKRAFWGRRTHPDLVLKDGRVDKGPFEAIIHEAVLGTTFRTLDDTSSINIGIEASPEWKRFASSVLLCLPQVVERAKFEAEFTRCASFLVSGAEESKQDIERTRVAWLSAEYVSLHGPPSNMEAWEAFRRETIPSSTMSNSTILPPSSSSVEGIYHDSPDMGTFSPRPVDAAKMTSLASAFGLAASTSTIPPSPARSNKSKSRGRTWSLLEQDGFTRDVFLRLDVETLARSFLWYNRSLLESDSASFTANTVLGHSTDLELSQFFGSDESPHWLTRLVVVQILGPGSVGTGRDDEGSRTSPTHTRSEVISRWAKVGELCRLGGDECSWRAVMAAVCSKPIARLEKAWKRVDSQAVTIVRSWTNASQGFEKLCVQEPRTTPWGADARQKAINLLSRVQDGKGAEWHCAPMEEAKRVYDTVLSSFSACVKKLNLLDPCDEDDLVRLSHLWHESSKAPAPKSTHIDQYMSLSYAAEPRRKGRFAPYYWTRPAGIQGLQALLPLAFPEPLPTVTLIDRSQITRSKKISLESAPIMSGIHMSRILELKASLEIKGGNNTDRTARQRLGGPNGIELGGTVLPVFDGELLLLVQSGPEIPSRPVSTVDTPDSTPSRVPSIRVKPAAPRLDRKASRARRSSLPALSQRTVIPVAEPSTEPALRVVVQAGTLDALVHLLVHGLDGVTVSVSDDNGEMALRDGNTRSVKVDRGEFAAVWWNVFRSFVSPLVLFELLRKEFLTKSPKDSLSVLDLKQAIRSRLNVIETLSEWIHKGGGAQDALDDLDLFTSITSFLGSSTEFTVPPNVTQDDELGRLCELLEIARKSLLDSFVSQSMRPVIRLSPVRGTVNASPAHVFGSAPPAVDELMPAEFVDNLDALAGAAFRNLVQDDLFVTADLLEVQTADRIGWFLPRELTSTSEDIEIQTMYTHIMDAEPTLLIGELTSDSLYRLLPPGIRSLIRAHNIMRKWAISKLVEPNIGLKVRQSRMELFLQSIEICRLRSIDAPNSEDSVVERPCIRSFVEAVLTAAVVSPESRLFHRAWQGVATSRGVNPESLAALLSRPFTREAPSPDRLTVDPAWLIERMLEVISLPDVLDTSSATPVNLVNFDKRRHLCNLILNSSSFTAPRASQQRREMDRCDFERLNNIEREIAELNLDYRTIREDAQKEAFNFGQPSTPNNKRNLRPFQKLIIIQQEKIKRDRYIRERLLKEKRLEQQRHDRREEDINRAMESRKSMIPSHKQHRSKRSMSAFFRVMRPISTALSSDNISPSSQRRNAAELDFTPSQKPALALSLVDARVAQFINNERSFTFQLDTEDGGHYLLQATTKAEMNKWISSVHNTVQAYAQRRLTYLGDSPKPQLSDHIHSRPKTASRDPVAVFGVDLTFLVTREAGDSEEVPPGIVPRVLELCLQEIETRGLTEVGIYRVAGATTEVAALREALNKGKASIDRSTDIHAVGDCVKYWLRTLPEPIFPEIYYHAIIDAANTPDLEGRLTKIREVVHSLPRAHYNVLKRLIEHLDRVADFEDKNHMTPGNLSVVFSPNLLRAPQNNFGVIMKNMGTTQVLTKALITHLHVIFNETDGDGDNEDEDDEDGEEDDEEDTGDFGESAVADADEDGDGVTPEPPSPEGD